MNDPLRLRPTCLCVLAWLSAAPLAFSQTTTEPLPTDEEVLMLSAFEVRSARDTGYTVQNSVATTGVAQEIYRTPLPITVVTDEFLRDTGRSGFIGALGYTSGVVFDVSAADGSTMPGLGAGQQNRTRFRGQPYNGTQRNGLLLTTGFDTENVDRIEVAKGPMAVFVGGATLGGVVNLITKKPQFSWRHELTARAASHDRYLAAIDSTGPVNEHFAYRLIASHDEGNTWRDDSYSRTQFVNPQLLWRFGSYQGRVDGVWRRAEGNLVSFSEISTGNYQQAFDNPPADLLALGTRTALGRPYTVDEYRARIGQAFGNWRQDVFDASGRWVSLGEGEGFARGHWSRGYATNHFGPRAPFASELDLFETEHTLAVTEWLDVRAIGRVLESTNEQLYFNFPTRLYPSGNTLLTFGNSRRVRTKSGEGKLEAVLKREVWGLNNTLLLGYQTGSIETTGEGGAWDAAALAPRPGSPNVFGSPATLTGTQIYQWFDPRFHEFPDHRIAQRWASDVRPAGVQAFDRTKDNPRAHYAALNSTFWDNRIALTGGLRRSNDYRRTSILDRDGAVVGTPADTGRVKTDSFMYGGSVEVTPGVSIYASYNEGETYQAGSMVQVFSTGQPDLTTPQERAANPRPNSLGVGHEAGVKVQLFDRKLTGSFGYFKLTRGNTLVTDEARMAADPRNVGTEVDTNPATTNPGVRPRITWWRPIDGNVSQGFEGDWVWTPSPNYSAVLGFTHLVTNEQTVVEPASQDPVTRRDFEILNGRPLENSPDTIIRLWQRYLFTEGRLEGFSVGLGVRHQSSYMPNANESAWGTVIPGFTVYDVVFGYQTKFFGRDTSLLLQIDNLTDKLYSDGGRHISPPRQFGLTVRTRF